MKTSEVLLLGAAGYLLYVITSSKSAAAVPAAAPAAPISAPVVVYTGTTSTGKSLGKITTPISETIVSPSGQLQSGIPNVFNEVKNPQSIAPAPKAPAPVSSGSSSRSSSSSSSTGTVSPTYLNHSNPAVAANAAAWASSGRTIPVALR